MAVVHQSIVCLGDHFVHQISVYRCGVGAFINWAFIVRIVERT